MSSDFLGCWRCLLTVKVPKRVGMVLVTFDSFTTFITLFFRVYSENWTWEKYNFGLDSSSSSLAITTLKQFRRKGHLIGSVINTPRILYLGMEFCSQ